MLGVFDIGGTGYRTATAEIKNQIANIKTGETPSNYKEGILSLISSLEESGAEEKFEKVAGCIAGVIDQNSGKLIKSPNLEDWVGRPLRTDLEKEFGCEVILENDAAAEGLGEAVFGAGKDYSLMGFFTAGTGIGGSVIKNKTIYIRYEPGEIDDLEKKAGGKALGDLSKVDWKKEAEMLAVGINNMFTQFDPEIMVLGGSLFKSIDLEYLQSLVAGKIVRGSLGQEAGLYGCLQLCK